MRIQGKCFRNCVCLSIQKRTERMQRELIIISRAKSLERRIR